VRERYREREIDKEVAEVRPQVYSVKHENQTLQLERENGCLNYVKKHLIYLISCCNKKMIF